jgi:hypothetical protein
MFLFYTPYFLGVKNDIIIKMNHSTHKYAYHKIFFIEFWLVNYKT